MLAAEEFAMPTGGGALPGPGGLDPRTLLPALALLALRSCCCCAAARLTQG